MPICANTFQHDSFFTYCTIDCHITIQFVAANRYVYQHPRTARDKYILVFREYEPRSVFLPSTGETPTVVLSFVRSDGVRKGAKRAALELWTVVARKYFASFIILGSVSSGRKMSTYKYEAPGI